MKGDTPSLPSPSHWQKEPWLHCDALVHHQEGLRLADGGLGMGWMALHWARDPEHVSSPFCMWLRGITPQSDMIHLHAMPQGTMCITCKLLP